MDIGLETKASFLPLLPSTPPGLRQCKMSNLTDVEATFSVLWVLGFVVTKKKKQPSCQFHSREHLASGWPVPNPPLPGDEGAEFPGI